MMTDKETDAAIMGLVLGAIFVMLIMGFFVIGKNQDIKELKKQAIELEHAYHHPKTGKFTWKEKVDESL